MQGRLTTKTFADTTTIAYGYETTTSRLKTVIDALSQVKTYTNANDDRLTGVAYTGAVNPTPNVSFAWDTYFPRLVSMTDGIGTRQYAYVPVGSLGALKVQQESGPFANSAIASAYDELGRLASRTVQGAGVETFQYDTIGRLSGHGSDLGAFTLGYLGQTDQITSRQLASSTLATAWTYLNNAGDRRLAGIANTGLTAGHFSNFTFTSTREYQLASIGETSDATAVYPSALTQSGTFNTINQLTNLSGQALTWDSVGNVTVDGQRTYTWDAENRLVGISYPGMPGKATAFAYDGFGRRVSITETPPGGGTPVTTRYLWCGQKLCQARDGSNVTMRSYYREGEFVPGSPGQPYYYGIDQLGSVRRAFASTTSAPAFNYDPYGTPLSGPALTTDFGFAKQFSHAASGLNLTKYRAYDPIAGRWLSRDPLGESADTSANLYSYVEGSPTSLIDPTGRNAIALIPAVVGCGPLCWVVIIGGSAIIVADAILRQGPNPPAPDATKPLEAIMPGDIGSEVWGRNRGLDPAEARRRFHRLKQACGGRGQDDYRVDTETGNVFDQNGEWVGNLADEDPAP